MMDDLQFYTHLNSILVISEQWHGGYERLCALKHSLDSDRSWPSAQCEPATELQIRGGIEDNSEIIFLISQQKHML